MLGTPCARFGGKFLCILVGVIALLLIATGALSPSTAGAQTIDHDTIVPEDPEGGYPIILDTPTVFNNTAAGCENGCDTPRSTHDINIIGNYLVSGGDFLNIRLQNGQQVSNPYLAIFDTRLSLIHI